MKLTSLDLRVNTTTIPKEESNEQGNIYERSDPNDYA